MRFLADECFPRAIVAALRELGHDVRYAAETDQRSSDEKIASIALDESRIVLTEDYDFGELAVRHGVSFAGVVILGCGTEPVAFKIERTLAALTELDEGILGCLTIVERHRLRQRPLAFD